MSTCSPHYPLCRVRLPIGDTLSDNAAKRLLRAHVIVIAGALTVRVAELELRNVAVKVLLGAMLVDTLHAALEDRKRALNRVRVDRRVFVIDVLAGTVAGEAMAGEDATKLAVRSLIRHHDGRA